MQSETQNPMRFFSEKVDSWGAAEWFNRAALAIREQDKAVAAKDEIAFETYRMIAASSLMTLVRDHEATVKAALSSAEPSVAVRALEWIDKPVYGNVYSRGGIYTYFVASSQSDGKWHTRRGFPADEFFGPFDTFEEAKAAAQADYDARIRSALSAQVQDADELNVAMSLPVALDFADNPRPYHTLQAPADTNGELYRAIKTIAAAYRSAQPLGEVVAEIVSAHGDPEAFGERELVARVDIQKYRYGTKLYAAAPAKPGSAE